MGSDVSQTGPFSGGRLRAKGGHRPSLRFPGTLGPAAGRTLRSVLRTLRAPRRTCDTAASGRSKSSWPRRQGLKDAERQGEALQVPLSIWMCDTDIRVTRVLYTEILDDAQWYIGKTEFDWLSAEEARLVRAVKRRALETRLPVRERLSFVFEGKLCDFDMLVIPDLDHRGEATGITCFALDLSEAGESGVRPAEGKGILRTLASLLQRRAQGPAAAPEGALSLGEAAVDYLSHGLKGPRGRVRLTKTEWQVLLYLVAHRGRVLTHEEIIEQVWGAPYRDAHHLLHDTVSRLRHRFLAAGLARDPLETVHGVGYRLVEDR